MSPFILIAILASAGLPLYGASNPAGLHDVAAPHMDAVGHRAPGPQALPPSQGSIVTQRKIILGAASADDTDRGCCVWKTTPPKCAYANRSYCSHKAKQAGKAFEFHKNTECKKVSACKR